MPAIGQVAKQTGLKVTTIRFYEAEGLLAAPKRAANGRRVYADVEVKRLAFIRHARALGFELGDIRSLLDLTDDPNKSCAEADEIASGHLRVVEERIAQLTQLRTELARIARSCAGGRSVGQCRVIEALAGHDQCATQHAPPAKVPKRRAKKAVRR